MCAGRIRLRRRRGISIFGFESSGESATIGTGLTPKAGEVKSVVLPVV